MNLAERYRTLRREGYGKSVIKAVIRDHIRDNLITRSSYYERDYNRKKSLSNRIGRAVSKAIATQSTDGASGAVLNQLVHLNRIARCNHCDQWHFGVSRISLNGFHSQGYYCKEHRDLQIIDVINVYGETTKGLRERSRRWDDGTYRDYDEAYSRGRLWNYSAKWSRALDDSPVQLGAELEISFNSELRRDKAVKEIHNIYNAGQCFAKSDGSITGFGAEFVTGFGEPRKISAILRKIAEVAKKYNGDCNSSCGLHVSYGRKNLSQRQVRQIEFFMSNEKNRNLLFHFQRRQPNRFCEVLGSAQNPNYLNMEYSDSGHYNIVDCRRDSHIEFRGFGGSLTCSLNSARLALVCEIVKYCETRRNHTELNQCDFLAWLETQTTATAKRVTSRINRSKTLLQLIKQPV